VTAPPVAPAQPAAAAHPRELRVKVADFAAAGDGAVIATIGLGSCVAIALHDARAGVGALAHVLLPDETLSRDAANRAKFATTAVPLLVEQVRRLGGRGPLTAKIVGGASMFAQLLPMGGTNMGARNVEATLTALAKAGIPLAAQDTGGDHGRSVFLHVSDGRVVVRSLKKGERVL
jgi:chemotaxis protein CheD